MRRGLSYFGEYRDRQMIAFAGVLGIGVALAMMEIIDAYRFPVETSRSPWPRS